SLSWYGGFTSLNNPVIDFAEFPSSCCPVFLSSFLHAISPLSKTKTKAALYIAGYLRLNNIKIYIPERWDCFK
ncbi:MAG TPA: hypothetical protein VF609_12845, partial [Flavisolibacter sp.]